MRRALAAALLVPVCTVFVDPARAFAADKEACLASYASGQRLMRASRLRDARQDLRVCASGDCPLALRGDCASWLADVQERMPTVAIVAREADGPSITEGRIVIDDDLAGAAAIDGRPLELDPGPHLFRLVREGKPNVETTVLVREGEKNQKVELVAASPKTSAATAEAPKAREQASAGPPWTAWAAGGVAVVATTSFALFGLSGRASQSSDLDPCKGHCADDAVDRVQTKYIVADVSLVVAVVAAGVSAFLFLRSPSAKAPASVSLR